MKQHITKKQWNELEEHQKLMFRMCIEELNELPEETSTVEEMDEWFRASIGQMIEFLGDDWNIIFDNTQNLVSKDRVAEYIIEKKQQPDKLGYQYNLFIYKEPVIGLWEACKEKLNK